ncbi:target of rapamycin complex 2 subunit MAPKAP1-like isoform X2 [Amphiura filiformis]|uniref:target of rapamycin complex 2 subunit MAPKAP1-like isoform X2 n=1 Tax=Amphiura filiformis TaxID=82378 RepID=UPI003B228C23
MALLDDPNFIIAHLRHAFITSDDTGMCEMAIMNEDVDWPERKKELEEKRRKPWSQFYNVDPDQTFDDLDIYADSYEIESSFDYGFRQRSNTAVRLEKLRQDRMVQNQCRKVQWKDDGMEFLDEELDDLFKKKKVHPPNIRRLKKHSALSQQMDTCPAVASNPFSEYAKFDGKAQVGSSSVIKQIDIYLDMCEGDAREFPMELHVMGTARVIDVIGLICWHYTNDGYEPQLSENVENYALMIAEEDGEVDTDFPALDSKEAISKFGFNTLALTEKELPKPVVAEKVEGKLLVTVRSSDGESRIAVDSMTITVRDIMARALKKRKGIIPTAGPDYILEKEDEPGVSLDLDKKLSDCNTMCFLMVREHSKREYTKDRVRHVSTGDPPLVLSTQYHSYRLQMLHKLRPTTEIQLGISGDKIEIDPVRTQPKNTANMAAKKFWGKQKAVSIESDRLADCLITEEKPSGKAIFRLTYRSTNHDFKHHDFETDQVTAKRIVTKIQQILEIRASAVRTDYNMWKERRQSSKKHHDK